MGLLKHLLLFIIGLVLLELVLNFLGLPTPFQLTYILIKALLTATPA